MPSITELHGAISMGMKAVVVDIDKDGDMEVVSPGKPGLYVFYNMGKGRPARPKMRLLPEETYPDWFPWHKK